MSIEEDVRELQRSAVTKKGMKKYLDQEFFITEDHINAPVTNWQITNPDQYGDSTITNNKLVDNTITITKVSADVVRKTLVFYVPGTLTLADDVSAEIKMPATPNWRFTTVDLRLKTAPSGGNCSIRIEDDGASAITGSIANGATTAQLSVNVTMLGGSVITLDLTAVNGAADLTVSAHFVPVDP